MVSGGADPRAASRASAAAVEELQRADARTRLAADQTVAARYSAALRMRRETEICLAAGIAPRSGRGGQCHRFARDLARPRLRASRELQRTDARMKLAAARVVAVGCSAAQ